MQRQTHPIPLHRANCIRYRKLIHQHHSKTITHEFPLSFMRFRPRVQHGIDGYLVNGECCGPLWRSLMPRSQTRRNATTHSRLLPQLYPHLDITVFLPRTAASAVDSPTVCEWMEDVLYPFPRRLWAGSIRWGVRDC